MQSKANGTVEIYGILKKIFVAVLISIAVSVPTAIWYAGMVYQNIQTIRENISEIRKEIKEIPINKTRVETLERRLDHIEDKLQSR